MFDTFLLWLLRIMLFWVYLGISIALWWHFYVGISTKVLGWGLFILVAFIYLNIEQVRGRYLPSGNFLFLALVGLVIAMRPRRTNKAEYSDTVNYSIDFYGLPTRAVMGGIGGTSLQGYLNLVSGLGDWTYLVDAAAHFLQTIAFTLLLLDIHGGTREGLWQKAKTLFNVVTPFARAPSSA